MCARRQDKGRTKSERRRPLRGRRRLSGWAQGSASAATPRSNTTAKDPTEHRTIANDYTCYHPLRSEAFDMRLLRILPGNDDEGLVVTVVRTNLSSHPEYRALSYCWGGLGDLKPIAIVFEDHVNVRASGESVTNHEAPRGVDFQVTANLHDVLLSFRRSKEQGYLWVDMLCINQGDVNERSGQVRFMRSIYESAASVVVWLGADPELRDSLFAPENYEIALANLALESGWVGMPYVLRFLAEFVTLRSGLDASGLEDCHEMYKYDSGLTSAGEGLKWEGQIKSTACSSAFTALLAEAQPVFDRFPVADRPSETPLRGRLLQDVCEIALGEPTKAPRGLVRVFRAYRSRTTTPGSEVYHWFHWLSYILGLVERPDSPPDKMMRRASRIAEAPWFQRVWVIQEVASNKTVRLRVGEGEGNWDLLRGLREFVTGLMMMQIKAGWEVIPGLTSISGIPMLWTDLAHWRDSGTVTIAKLLDDLPSFTATDPRDRVIALSGIARDLQPGLFVPDYTTSVAETYARFALSVIGSTQNLDILSDAQIGLRESRPAELPSWAPDFSKSQSGHNTPGRDIAEGLTVPRTQVRMNWTEGWRALHIKGLRAARVAKIISAQAVDDLVRSRGGNGPIPRLAYVPLPELWVLVNQVYSETFSAAGGRPRLGLTRPTLWAFCNILMPGRPGEHWHDFLELWHGQDPEGAAPGVLQETRDELVEGMRKAQRRYRPSHSMDAQLLMTLSFHRMCFFFSEDGDLGLCPEATRRGDSVVAFYGLGNLVVLRTLEGIRQGTGYQLIGNCRVYGAAWSAARRVVEEWESKRKGPLKSEFFHLE